MTTSAHITGTPTQNAPLSDVSSSDVSLSDVSSSDGTLLPHTGPVTENGAPSLATSGLAIVDLFFKLMRNTLPESLNGLLTAAWATSPLDTLKIIFHLRDCRGGKGERKQFHFCLQWLVNHGAKDQVLANLDNIPFFGTFKDMFALCDTAVEPAILQAYADYLQRDIEHLAAGHQLSLAGKWAPTEGCSIDKKYRVVNKLVKLLRPYGIKNPADYRRKILVPLRRHLDIVETHMCERDWEHINYSAVPSVAMQKYKHIFRAHAAETFEKYLTDVAAGRKKINTKMIFPYQLVEHYLDENSYDENSYDENSYNETIELSWKQMVLETAAKYAEAGKSALAIVDVSGSMAGQPLNVAISLGLLLAEIASGPFRGQVISFSDSPVMHRIDTNATLQAKVAQMKRLDWKINTNLNRVFDLILNAATMYKVPAENMPQTLYIFSDMQFDIACKHRTNFEVIDAKYISAGYKRPAIVFWNLRGNTIDFPAAANSQDVALVSGFSPSLLQIFMGGANLTPYSAMRAAIDNERYSRVVLASNTS